MKNEISLIEKTVQHQGHSVTTRIRYHAITVTDNSSNSCTSAIFVEKEKPTKETVSCTTGGRGGSEYSLCK